MESLVVLANKHLSTESQCYDIHGTDMLDKHDGTLFLCSYHLMRMREYMKHMSSTCDSHACPRYWFCGKILVELNLGTKS